MGRHVTDVGLEKPEGKRELKKHAATIHCSNTLSLLQRKVSNALLYHAYQELLLKEEHEISVKQLCNLISYSGNNHSVIKDALKGLLSTVIEWNLVNIGKAGRSRGLGIRPTVRGTVMNPVDHPYGGGEGKQPRGTKRPKTIWGKVTGGRKTRNANKWSNALIVKRRPKVR